MRTYDTYKDSGISWLGLIPSHWESRKFKFTFSERKQKGFPDEPLLAATQSHGVIPKDLYETRTMVATKGLETLKLVEKGDFVISLRSFQGGIEYAYYRGIISPAYTVLTPTAISANYFKYLGKCQSFIALLKSSVTGIREGQNIDYCKLRENLLPLPPVNEQETIAAYLDSATAEIDKAIASQQRMVELLQERKQIIINQAVTQGLNPDAPMKPTNIDWLPQIPAHWQLYRLGALGAFSKGSGIARDDLQDEGLPAILYGDIYTKYEISVRNLKNKISEKTAQNAVKIQAGDILLTGSGETKEDIGKTILYEGNEAYAGGDVIIFRQQSQDGKFLSYLLNSFYSRRYKAATSKGEIVVHTYPYILKDLYLPIPPLEEQEGIAHNLDKNCSEIEAAITRCEQKIALLTERKQILINDVVTGKIKII